MDVTEGKNPEADVYRVRVSPNPRRTLFGCEFGRRVWVVEIDYLSDSPESGDQLVASYWFKAADQGCAIAFGVDQARELHDHAGSCPNCTPDGSDGPGPLVIHVGPNVVVDERVPA